MNHILGMKSKKKALLGATCLFLFLFTACVKKDIIRTTLVFEKTGAITLHIVEPWDDSLYSYDELVAMNEKEVNDYNASSQSVSILSSELKNGKVYIQMQYVGDDSYFDLNKKNIFYDRADKAKGAGYNLVKKVKDVKSGELLLPAQWNEMDSQKVIIVSENVDIITATGILYASAGITVTGDNTATVVDADELSYIICE